MFQSKKILLSLAYTFILLTSIRPVFAHDEPSQSSPVSQKVTILPAARGFKTEKDLDTYYHSKNFQADQEILYILKPEDPNYQKAGTAGYYQHLGTQRNTVTLEIDHAHQKKVSVDLKDAPGFLYFQFPYDAKWEALINNQPQPIIQANQTQMALKLNQGQHRVTLTYNQYPWLNNLLALFPLAIAAAIPLFLKFLNRQKAKKNLIKPTQPK